MPQTDHRQSAPLLSRRGALCYAAWGILHSKVAADIWHLGAGQHGLALRHFCQLAACDHTARSGERQREVIRWRNREWATKLPGV
ncbi:hypothetical protein, partial [Clostridium perfringens]